MPYCVYCGAKNEEGAQTCVACGQPLKRRDPAGGRPVNGRLIDDTRILFTGANVGEILIGLFKRPTAIFRGLRGWTTKAPVGVVVVGAKAVIYAIYATIIMTAMTPPYLRMFTRGAASRVFFWVLFGTIFCYGLMWLVTWLIAEFGFRTRIDRRALMNLLGVLGVYNLAAVTAALMVQFISLGMASAIIAVGSLLSSVCLFVGLEYITDLSRDRALWLTAAAQGGDLLVLGLVLQLVVRIARTQMGLPF